jgi:hypothetical protein
MNDPEDHVPSTICDGGQMCEREGGRDESILCNVACQTDVELSSSP